MTHKGEHCTVFLSDTEKLAHEAARQLQGITMQYDLLFAFMHSYFVQAQAIATQENIKGVETVHTKKHGEY